MNKNKAFVIISIASFLIIFVSLIFMMTLTPSTKKNSSLYKKENQATNVPVKISTEFIGSMIICVETRFSSNKYLKRYIQKNLKQHVGIDV